MVLGSSIEGVGAQLRWGSDAILASPGASVDGMEAAMGTRTTEWRCKRVGAM